MGDAAVEGARPNGLVMADGKKTKKQKIRKAKMNEREIIHSPVG